MEIILHRLNIVIHVMAGFSALLIGLAALILPKTKNIHKKLGRLFLKLMIITVFTGLIGVFLYGRNTFLLVITILSGYLAFSGCRTIKRKSNQANFLDISMALISILVVGYFLYYFNQYRMIWSPVIVYSTVGYLCMVVAYDLIRYTLSPQFYSKLWMKEHIFKMVSAFSGLLSAFTGTVFPTYQPYSQFLPSVFGMLIIVVFISAFKLDKVRK